MPVFGCYDYNTHAMKRQKEKLRRMKERKRAKWQKIKDDFAKRRQVQSGA